MLPTVIGVSCAIWLFSALTTFLYGLYRSSGTYPNDEIERDVYDGSGIVAGAIAALMLGPIGIVFLAKSTACHEATHLGAALRGQSDELLRGGLTHELLVPPKKPNSSGFSLSAIDVPNTIGTARVSCQN